MSEFDTADPKSDSRGLSNDDIYDVLADRRRRYLIHYLKQRENPVPIDEIVEQVAAWENDKTTDSITAQERKRVYISLYQSHLPSLDEQGIIEYEEEASTVSLTPEIAERDIYLEIVPKHDIPWSIYYLGLTAANGLLLGLAWFDVAPFHLISNLTIAAVIFVTFGLSALAQTLFDTRKQLGQPGPPPGVETTDEP